MDKEQKVVYWAPAYGSDVDKNNWNILYSEPVQLFKYLNEKRDSGVLPQDNYLSCPASNIRLRNTYFFKNELATHVKIINNLVVPQTENYIKTDILRGPSLKNNTMINLALNWIFFSEDESMKIHVNPPFFNNAPYLKYGSFCPGGFDIGQWFRPVATEINLWENVDEFIIEENEPIFYIEFLTESPVILKRFVYTDTLRSFAESSMKSSSILGKWLPLSKKYEQFNKTKSREIVLNEIRKNLV